MSFYPSPQRRRPTLLGRGCGCIIMAIVVGISTITLIGMLISALFGAFWITESADQPGSGSTGTSEPSSIQFHSPGPSSGG